MITEPDKVGTFPARLAAIAARYDMTQAEMADYLGVPQSTLANWEAGVRTPSQSCLRLLDVLGTIEVLAPAIHATFLPARRVDKRSKAYRDSIGRQPNGGPRKHLPAVLP